MALRDRRRVPNVVIRDTTGTRTDVTPVVMDATGVTKLTPVVRPEKAGRNYSHPYS